MRDGPAAGAHPDGPVVWSMELGPLKNRAYLFGDGAVHEAVLIDVGQGPDAFLDRVKDEGWTVTGLFATHAHFDHIGGLSVAQTVTGASIRVPWGEAEWLFDPEKNLSAWFARRLGDESMCVALDRTAVVVPMQAEAVFSVGRFQVRSISTPGHSPDARCYLAAEAHVLFTGDTLFAGTVGRSDLPGSDPGRLAASLRLVAEAGPADTVVLPGHGPPTSLGHEQATNPYLAFLP